MKKPKDFADSVIADSQRGVMIWMVVGGVIVTLVIGGVLAAKVISERPAREPASDAPGPHGPAAGVEKQQGWFSYTMDTFVVTLTPEDFQGRYIMLTLQVEIKAEFKGERILREMPRVKDSLITFLSKKRMEDLASIQSKHRLREAMKSRINEVLGTGAVRQVYILQFVVREA